MNQTQTRSLRKKVLSLILAVVMAVSLLPISAFASGDSKASTTASTDEFVRIFHLDCGRKYFSVKQIEELIDAASDANYTHVELAIGNDGLRFLLDNMAVGTYTSENVTAGIQQGNKNYYNAGDKNELTQSEMDEIINHAKSKNISIIPLLNSPGHMDAIIDCMETLGMSNVAFSANWYTSARTIDLNNTQAVAFTQALVKKYVEYFAGKGCEYFNMGADEYANDKLGEYTGSGGAGFGYLIDKGDYSKFVTYVNNLAAIIKDAGKSTNMKPIAFNDGIYYNKNTTSGTFDTDIIVSYWTSGYGNYTPAPASFLANKGHKIINTRDNWYYTLGDANPSYTYAKAEKAVQSIKVTDVSGGNVTPIGCMLAFWCDEPSAQYNDTEAKNVKGLISTLAANNESYFKATNTTPGTDTGDTETKKTITVSVGSTVTATLNGAYSGEWLNDDIAKVTGEVKDVAGGTTYERVTDLTAGTFYVSTDANDTAPNVPLTVEVANGQYYIKNSNGWYVYPTASYDWFYGWQYSVSNGRMAVTITSTSNNGFVISKNTSDKWGGSTTAYLQLSGSNFTASGSSTTLYLYKEKDLPAGQQTTLTFTGKTVGTTTVTIGGVEYTINVVDKAPSNAMTDTSIDLEYWITNNEVYETQSKTGHTKTITTTTDGATADEGIAITDIAPNHAYSFFDGTKDVYYWQAMRLDIDNEQTDASGDDETSDGTTLTHIRYYGGAWQYKTVDGTWHYFVSTDQLVAYYLQKVASTKEVTTYVKDWGFSTTNENTNDNTTGGQVALTVAVVYPDGSVSPAEGDMYQNSTTILNYREGGRDIGIVAPINNSDYNISKITVTDGARTARKDSKNTRYYWYKDDSITWQKKTLASGGEWYDETTVWDKSMGTTPMVNGKSNNVKWTAKNTAKLVLIYLEPIVKDTNLNVVYQDDSTNTEISRYQIVMSYNQGQDQPTFDTSLKNSSGAVIGTTKNWPGKESSEPGYLPDDAYVTNSSQKDQKIDKNLATITGISGIYASGLYEYVGADISEDGKTLTLHYNLKNTTAATFVMDFGLPLQIPFDKFGIADRNQVETVSFLESDKKAYERDGNYGHGSIAVGTWDVTYTLTKTLDSKIPIPIYVTFKNDSRVRCYNVYVIPATSVYYEDSFATFTNADSTKNVAQVDNAGKGIWTKVTDGTTQATDVHQALEALGGTTNTKNVYGYDPAYADSSKFSMGSATKVTVAADTYKEGKTQWPTATFTFKGTGFDVISLTDNTSGTIFVTVKDKATGKVVKSSAVNNYYGYKYQGDKWVATKNDPNCLYQIPVMKIAGLDYAEYEVMIQVAYASFLDEANAGSYNFWLDAIRVYDPMGKDNATYEQDNEGYPQYIKLHDSLVGGTATAETGSVFIDGAAKATIAQYKNYGPNNEVYLAKGQAISFTVAENKDIATIQIGAKAPNGTANMTVNNTEAVNGGISTATEMYYKLDVQPGQQVTISNTGDGILSLTNLKITFNSKPTAPASLAALTTADQENAVAQVRALFAEPVEPFNPDLFTASWGHSVRKGDTATLTVKTSEDVEAIEVDGQMIDKYVTRTERTGWGWWAKTVTFREFTYTDTATVTKDYTVCAVNGKGVSSDAITATLTVRPSVRDWLHGIFGKWF